MSDGLNRRVPLDLSGPVGRRDLFLLEGATKNDPAVEAWMADPAMLRGLARQWFSHIRRCGDDVREVMHDGCPTACVEGAAFAYVNAFRRHVSVGFFHGAALADSAGLLEGSGTRMRHVKLLPDQPIDTDGMLALIHSAYVDISARLGEDTASISRP